MFSLCIKVEICFQTIEVFFNLLVFSVGNVIFTVNLNNLTKVKLIIINTFNVFQVWDLFYQANHVRAMLTRLIKEESLRTYLFTYSHVYDSISMATLAEMFELEKPSVHSIISKMIINEELMVNNSDELTEPLYHFSLTGFSR